MLPLSAADCISPAIARSHALLFRPFRWGTTWKLAVVSYLAICGAFFVPWPLLLVFLPGLPGSAVGKAGLLALLVLGTLVFCGLFYLCVRLEFVAFEMLVTGERRIAPMWRRYGARVWPWLGAKAVVGTVLSLACAAWVVPAFVYLVHHPPPPGSQPTFETSGAYFYGILRVEAAFFLWFVLMKLADTLLHDFVLPVCVLEPVSLGTAIARGWQLLQRNAGASALFLLLKLVFGFAGYIGAYLASMLTLIPLGLVFFALGFGGSAALHRVSAPAGPVLLGVGAVLLGLLGFAVLLYTQLGLYGYVVNLLDSFAIVFLGGRYGPLGEMLDPAARQVFTPPAPPADPPSDDDAGLPMNPALA